MKKLVLCDNAICNSLALYLKVFILPTSLPFISVIETASVVVVLYESIRKYLPAWVSLWDFIGMMVFWALLIMLGTYLFVLKPLWTYRGRQMTGINEKLDTVTKQLADVTERLDKMTAEKAEKVNK